MISGGVSRASSRGVQEHQPHPADEGRGHQADDDGAGHRLFHFVRVPGAVGPGGDDGQAVADAQPKSPPAAHRWSRRRPPPPGRYPPRMLPTIMVSAALYSCWNRLEIKMGMAKISRFPEDGPVHQVHLPGRCMVHGFPVFLLCTPRRGPRLSGSRVEYSYQSGWIRFPGSRSLRRSAPGRW